jgi:hypothetical protein
LEPGVYDVCYAGECSTHALAAGSVISVGGSQKGDDAS